VLVRCALRFGFSPSRSGDRRLGRRTDVYEVGLSLEVRAGPGRCDDTTIAGRGPVVGMEANVMIQTFRSLPSRSVGPRARACGQASNEAFDVNGHDRFDFPSNVSSDLDFSVLEILARCLQEAHRG
jgi:hypothetical protein